jgi:hypothetical protein
MKIPHDIEPIGHISPRPRIDLNPRRVQPDNIQTTPCEGLSIHEKQHIWQLVVQVAESSNIGAEEI